MKNNSVLKQAAAALTATIFVLGMVQGKAQAMSAEFTGTPVNVYLDTQSPEVHFLIPQNSVENIQDIDPDSNMRISNVASEDERDVTCVYSESGYHCSIPFLDLMSLSDDNLPWEEELFSFAVITRRKNGEILAWPLKFFKVDNLVPSQIEITDSVKSEYLVGVDSKNIKLSIRLTNRLRDPIDAQISISLEERILYSNTSTNGSANFTFDSSILQAGENEFFFEARNEYGAIEQSYVMTRSLPLVKLISIDAPKVFYPAKDSFEDSLRFTVNIQSGSSKPFTGTGSMRLTTSAGKVLMKSSFTRPGKYTFTYKPPASGYFVGEMTLFSEFQPKSGNKVTRSMKISSSSKKMVERQGTVTVSAWEALNDCGSSYSPCKRGSLSGSPNGIALYNDPFDLDHRSEFFVKLPAGAFKWKLSLGGIWTGLSAPSYNLTATDGSFSESKGYLGSTPGIVDWEGAWSSKTWVYSVDDGGANWIFTSYEPGNLYFRTVTIQYSTRTLR